MTPNNILVAVGIVFLTSLTYFQFPGHTYLQSDTQIYVPILEHLWDASVFTQEILAKVPHVSFTLYDEAALALRKLTGMGFREVLTAEQLVCRALGIWGLYLIGRALSLSTLPALLITAIVSLGATIAGPAVLTFEYEPVPRGLALPLLYLATGLVAHRRFIAAGIAGSIAFLYHAPTIYPFWCIYLCLVLLPSDRETGGRRFYGLVPLLIAALLLAMASRYQAGERETQVFFSRLEPMQEYLQRLRASYAWISLWWQNWLAQYLVLYAATLAVYFRLRKSAGVEMQMFLIGYPLIGILSMPLSYLLLERMHWALIPQLQPMRALLFITLFAVLGGAVCGVKAIKQQRYFEAFLWFSLAYLVPTNTRILVLPSRNRIVVVVVLAASACLALRFYFQGRRWAPLLVTAVAVGGFFLIPKYGKVRNYPSLHDPELSSLAQWARTSTPKDTIFLFPEAGRALYPGIFRSEALRAVYCDWKGGGQVNFLKKVGEEWWSRWQNTMAKPFEQSKLTDYRGLGIDYVVLKPEHRLVGRMPDYQNSEYVAYKL